ncbi:YheC/YheD family protein [Cohnella soli]|uniref:YheC/YheD family protein n=1 Tax=Cohnella soli TaxID=425005 RepID=A0ABW0I0N5_9BACL
MSKWLKTKAVLHDPHVRKHVPETRRMTAQSLRLMLDRYAMVYIKPDAGSYGKGVMRVEKNGGKYSYQTEEKKRIFDSFSLLYRSILLHKRNRPYLVQKGIHLLKYKGRRFDIRVMVQRNFQKKWEMTGMIGRVAHPKRIVTNYHSGGKPMEIRTLLTPLTSGATRTRIINNIAATGYAAAIALSRKYPKLVAVGADIGLDTDFRPWIIELNTSPDPYIFRHLPNKNVVRKILRYTRSN